MGEFVTVAKVPQTQAGKITLHEVNGRRIALCRVGDRFYAIDDVCTHDGGPLAEGELSGHAIACPRHGAKFDIRDGRALTMPATQDTVAHEVEVRGGEVFVKLKD
jgi:3-phenylpropionate/trans-cinnamate dioxygenase ferredoxin subunit